MKTFRKVLFWIHLVSGLLAGLVILIMSATGVLLTYERQMTAWAESDQRIVQPPADARPLAPEALLKELVRQRPEAQPSSVVFRANPAESVSVSLGREGTVFLNPYTAEILGEGAKGTREFFHGVTDLHRFVGAHGEARAAGKSVTGASNLVFLFLAISGIYLWWPKRWTRQHLRPVLVFQRGLSGRARDFNWHNVIGFWCAPVLIVLTVTASAISYPWVTRLLYTLTGTEPPPQQGGPGGGRGPEGRPAGAEGRPGQERGQRPEGRREGGPEGREGRPEGAGAREDRGNQPPGNAERAGQQVPEDQQSGSAERGQQGPEGRSEGRGEGRPDGSGVREDRAGQEPRSPERGGSGAERGGPGGRGTSDAGAEKPPLLLDGLDRLYVRAQQQVTGWGGITLRIPQKPETPVSFTIEEGPDWNPFARGTLTLNPATAEVVTWEPFQELNAGRKLRTWFRFLHTGEALGWLGQLVAGIASLGGCVLVWTGMALSWRRFRGWRQRRAVRHPIRSGLNTP